MYSIYLLKPKSRFITICFTEIQAKAPVTSYRLDLKHAWNLSQGLNMELYTYNLRVMLQPVVCRQDPITLNTFFYYEYIGKQAKFNNNLVI